MIMDRSFRRCVTLRNTNLGGNRKIELGKDDGVYNSFAGSTSQSMPWNRYHMYVLEVINSKIVDEMTKLSKLDICVDDLYKKIDKIYKGELLEVPYIGFRRIDDSNLSFDEFKNETNFYLDQSINDIYSL